MVMFIDLRDRTGITQVVFNAERNAAVHKAAHALRSECVVSVTGQVMARPEESKNPNLSTGEIEVFVDAVEILNESKTPPFVIEDDAEVTEAIRLKYRYLDLRRPKMQRLLSLRHDIMQAVRGFLNAEGFLEVETPILTEKHAGRRTGLFGAEPGEPRSVLCASSVAAAVQAGAHGERGRSLLPDRALLPRRRSAQRPAAGVYTDRSWNCPLSIASRS